MSDNNNDESNLLNEALLDLAIILKRNNDLRQENIELRKQMGVKENESKEFRYSKSDSY